LIFYSFVESKGQDEVPEKESNVRVYRSFLDVQLFCRYFVFIGVQTFAVIFLIIGYNWKLTARDPEACDERVKLLDFVKII
jgi:hypothetical protein